jgi:hypothetical protein
VNEEDFINRYFKWVIDQAFATEQRQVMYHATLELLFEIPFTWYMVSDANRAGDASVFRHYERSELDKRKHKISPAWLDQWENDPRPSVLEVLVGICERWYQYYEYPTQFYFNQLFCNLGLQNYSGLVLSPKRQLEVREIIARWLNRNFDANGHGSPFPLNPQRFNPDMRFIDIWGQMNAYALEHFQ